MQTDPKAAVRASDEELLRAFVGGQRAALGELAERYEAYLLGLACGLLGGRRELACDAVQEAWVRVIRFAGGFDFRSAVKTWLYRIVVNQCRTAGFLQGAGSREKTGETPVPPERQAETPAPLSQARTLMPHSHVAADPVAKDEEQEQLRAAVAGLGAEQRTVVLLCYHAGLTYGEAAEILEIPVGTLKSRLHAALTELRAALGCEVKV